MLERELAIVYVATDGYTAPDLVVMAEPGEMEVIGAHGLEGWASLPTRCRKN